MKPRDPFPLLTAALVVAVCALAKSAERLDLAVYALSFWHYAVYALAFLWRRIPQDRFISDSLTLKAISLFALGIVLLSTPPSVLTLIVMLLGFGLSGAAARTLGSARTYYGVELAGLESKSVSAFPYNWLPHPMLLGSMLALGAPLLDAGFRGDWWPLAVLHVTLSFLILVNEAYCRKSRRAGWIVALFGFAAGTLMLLAGFGDILVHTLATLAICGLFELCILRRYG